MLVKGSEDYWLHVFDHHSQPDPYFAPGEIVVEEKMYVTCRRTGLRVTVQKRFVGMSYQEMFDEGKRQIEQIIAERAARPQGEK